MDDLNSYELLLIITQMFNNEIPLYLILVLDIGFLDIGVPARTLDSPAYMKGLIIPPTIEVRHQVLGLFSPLGLNRLTGSFVTLPLLRSGTKSLVCSASLRLHPLFSSLV